MSLLSGFLSFPGGSEWIIIFLVVLIVFGPKNLPKIGKAIGQGIREFKDASEGIQKAIEEEASSMDYREKEGHTEHHTAETTSEPEDHEHSD